MEALAAQKDTARALKRIADAAERIAGALEGEAVPGTDGRLKGPLAGIREAVEHGVYAQGRG